MQKGISYRLQNPRKSAKIKVYCMRCSITLWQLAKRAQITFGAVAKGHPFDHFACGICDLHAIYRWEILIQKKNGGEFKILFTIRGFCIHEGLPTIPLLGQSYLVRQYL